MKVLKARALAAAIIAAGAVAVVGCGSSGSESTATSGGGEDAAAAEKAVADTSVIDVNAPLTCDAKPSFDELQAYRAPKANEPYTIAFMEVSLSGYYYQALAYGATKAAEDAGVELNIIGGTGYSNPDQQLRQAENAILRGADAIVFAPADIKGSVPVVERALADGIPVVNISSEVDSAGVYSVVQDNYVLGQQTADQLAELLPEGGKGIVLAGPATGTWAQKQHAGFVDRIEEQYPQLEIVATSNQQVDPDEGLKDFTNAAQRHPDVDWIYAASTFVLLPDSIPAEHKGTPYVSFGFDPPAQAALEDGSLAETLTAAQVHNGYLGVGRAIELLNGEEPPRVTCLEGYPITKANIDSPEAQAELFPEGFKASGG